MRTTARAICTHPGCTETAFWTFDTAKQAAAHYKTRENWKCGRHSNPERNLSLDRLEIVTVLTNEKVMYRDTDTVLGLFWNGFSGLTHGDGYRAEAKDFPEGTKLIVTARIELPKSIPPVDPCDSSPPRVD